MPYLKNSAVCQKCKTAVMALKWICAECDKISCETCLYVDTDICLSCIEGCSNHSSLIKDNVMKKSEMVDDETNILKEAEAVINGERQDTYGNPEDSFAIIAGYWNIYLREKIKHKLVEFDVVDVINRLLDILNEKDVAVMMSLFKHARMLGQKEDRDNFKDAIGYLAIRADRLGKSSK